MRHGPWTAVGVGVVAFVVYSFCGLLYAQNRNDFFLLADAFLHGRIWIPQAELVGLWDRIDIGGRTYLPFAPLPGLVFMPLVALFGVPALTEWHFLVNSVLAAACVVLGYLVITRFGGSVLRDRLWLTALFAFSTPILSITVGGGPWHQGQLLATICSLAAILEARGRARPVLLGALGGAAFLARSPTIFALPFFTWAAATRGGRPVTMGPAARAAALVAAGAAPAIALWLWYNVARFGSPTESGYALASLPPFLAALRAQGLFSPAHVPRNLEYFLLHRPVFGGPPLFLRPDGLGTSVLLTSPGLLIGATRRPRDPFLVACALTAFAVFVPSLLYYGGGWVQVGFRYFLDAIPFLLPLVAASSRTGLGVGWKMLVATGIVVNLWAVPWIYGY